MVTFANTGATGATFNAAAVNAQIAAEQGQPAQPTVTPVTVPAGKISFVVTPADKLQGESLKLREKGKEALGLTKNEQVCVLGAIPSLAGIAGKFQPEQIAAILETLASAVQFDLLRTSLSGAGGVPAGEFEVAGFIDADVVAAKLWGAYNPVTKGSRGTSSLLSADDVERLYSEELADHISSIARAKNPTLNKAQEAKAHTLYCTLLTKLFSKAAINMDDGQFNIIGKLVEACAAMLQDNESFASKIYVRLQAVITAQEEKAKKLAADTLDIL